MSENHTSTGGSGRQSKSGPRPQSDAMKEAIEIGYFGVLAVLAPRAGVLMSSGQSETLSDIGARVSGLVILYSAPQSHAEDHAQPVPR